MNQKTQSGTNTLRTSRILNNRDVFHRVRDFVKSRRAARAHITATEVATFMQENVIISINYDENRQFDNKHYHAARRSVRRYLSRNGFQRRRVTGKVQFNAQHIARRNEHVIKILENRAKSDNERFPEVYKDESYVHQHHDQFMNNLYHPTTGFPEGKTPHKGRRLCFVAAINGQGRE